MKKRILAVVGGVAGAMTVTAANATGLTVPAIDLTDFYTAFGVVATAVVGIMIARKVKSLLSEVAPVSRTGWRRK